MLAQNERRGMVYGGNVNVTLARWDEETGGHFAWGCSSQVSPAGQRGGCGEGCRKFPFLSWAAVVSSTATRLGDSSTQRRCE